MYIDDILCRDVPTPNHQFSDEAKKHPTFKRGLNYYFPNHPKPDLAAQVSIQNWCQRKFLPETSPIVDWIEITIL
jgi:hypothetical protein